MGNCRPLACEVCVRHRAEKSCHVESGVKAFATKVFHLHNSAIIYFIL